MSALNAQDKVTVYANCLEWLAQEIEKYIDRSNIPLEDCFRLSAWSRFARRLKAHGTEAGTVELTERTPVGRVSNPKVEIKHYQPVDGEFWLVEVDGRLAAKVWSVGDAMLIADAVRMRAVAGDMRIACDIAVRVLEQVLVGDKNPNGIMDALRSASVQARRLGV